MTAVPLLADLLFPEGKAGPAGEADGESAFQRHCKAFIALVLRRRWIVLGASGGVKAFLDERGRSQDVVSFARWDGAHEASRALNRIATRAATRLQRTKPAPQNSPMHPSLPHGEVGQDTRMAAASAL